MLNFNISGILKNPLIFFNRSMAEGIRNEVKN